MIFWLTVRNSMGDKPEAWMRTVAIIGEDVYAPAILGGDEAVVARAAVMEGVRTLPSGKHVYAPTWWLATHYPDTAVFCRMVEAKAKRMFGAKLAAEGGAA